MDASISNSPIDNNQIKTISKILVSEEIFLALRPRADSFRFDERNVLSIAPALNGYLLLNSQQQIKPTIVSSTVPLKTEQPFIALVVPQNLAKKNPKDIEFAEESETDFENSENDK